MTRARTLADMISDGVIGTTELADDVITPVKLDETGSYEIAGLTVSTDVLGPVAIESTNSGAYIKFRDSTSSPSNQYAWMGVAGNEIRLFVNDTEYPVAFNAGGAVFNPQGGDNDFRVLSDVTNYALFVDGGANSGYGRVKISSSTISTNTSTLGGDADTYINGLTIESNEASYTNGGLSLVNKYDWGYGSSIDWQNVYDEPSGNLGVTNRITSQWRTGSHYSLDFFSMRSGSLVEHLSLGFNQSVFNEDSLDQDFRVESDNNTHMLFVDAGNDQVIVGTSTPITGVGAVMTLGGLGDTRLAIDGSNSSGLYLTDSGAQGITIRNAEGDLEFYGVATREFVFNEGSVDTDFRVESDAYSHIMFVDASENRVAIGHNSSAGYGSGHVLAVAGGSTQFSNFNADVTMQIRGGNYTDPHTASILLSGGTGDNGYVREWYMSSVASGGGGAIQNDLKFRYVAGGSATQYEALQLRHNGEVIVNEEGWGTHDFRVEADSNSNAFKVDAGENSGQGAVLVGTGSMFATGNTDYIAHTMTQEASTTPMLVNGAMFAMPDLPSGKQAQAGRWKFGGFKHHWYPSAGTRVDSSMSELVVEISGGTTGKTNMELFELGFNRGWESRPVTVEVYQKGYLNGGYKKYLFHGGYDPSFTLYENYGQNSISLDVLAEGPFQKGTSSVSSSTVDQSYYRKTVRATLAAYFSGYVVVTVPSYMKITNNSEVDTSGLMRLLNPQ